MRRLRGLLALVGILAILGGVPWLLLAIGASPVPSSTPQVGEIWDAVRQPADGAVFRTIFTYAAWLAWLFFALCIVVEVVARLAGAQAPDLPGLSLPQGMARSLVATAALLFIAAPAVTSVAGSASASPGGGAASAATASATASVVADQAGGAAAVASTTAEVGGGASDDAASSVEAGPEVATRTHTVAQGETLWSIAEQHLGDGARYDEILELNPGISSHWITPGAELQVPDETPAPSADDAGHEVTVQPGDTLWEIAEDELGDGSRYDEIAQASSDLEQPGGERLTDPDLIKPGWQLSVPGGTGSGGTGSGGADSDSTASDAGTASPGAAGSAETAPSTTAPSSPTTDDDPAADVPDDLGAETAADARSAVTAGDAATTVGQTAAATPATGESSETADPVLVADPDEGWAGTAVGIGGLTAVGLLGLLGAARRRGLRAGRRTSETTPLEGALRLAAEGHSRDTVDLALRDLARAAAAQDVALPGLQSVRLTRHHVDVQLDSPLVLPAPWTSTADARVWTLAAERARGLDALALAEVPPPYPALVSLGTDAEDAHVLVDLAHAQTLAVVGEQRTTRAVVAALALDLAGSAWADRTTITVVGGDPALVDAIGSPRLRHVPDATGYFVAAGVTAETTAREVVLVSGEPSAADRDRLVRTAASSPRIALVHTSETPVDGLWSLSVGADPDAAVLAPSQLQLRAQRADDAAVAAVVELFQLAVQSDDYWAPAQEPTLAAVGAAAAAMGSPGVVLDDDGRVVVSSEDDQPTRRHVDEITAARRVPLRWNTPVVATSGRAADEDTAALVETVRRATDSSWTATASTPRWLSNQVTPTPGVPLPPVVAFPLRDADLAAQVAGPVLRLLGPVDIDHGPEVREVHRARLTELAAYLHLHPGASDAELDDAMWPNRSGHDHARARLGALAALGDWIGELAPQRGAHDLTGAPESGRAAAAALPSDWDIWQRLLPGETRSAQTTDLEQALGLVRGRPFVGSRSRHYLWAAPLRSTMIEAICGAAAELARRRLLEGRVSAAYDATVVGLTVEPHAEPLWRLQVLAAHELDDELLEGAVAGLRELGGTDDAELDTGSRRLLEQVDQLERTHAVRGVG
ncbi:LysM peptidoglycan-binding domain-containing protein [Janibacter melonis]|uniref:LysM peptidoglycan-binding domain-containing protein n=1 Tax=Janibacter melonis TaxID=262209 RepID=UPI00174A07EA|nr:LysM peptidoglycan-binding domain-containing protein [Janibacter melonis]